MGLCPPLPLTLKAYSNPFKADPNLNPNLKPNVSTVARMHNGPSE